jgi:hypothetical protein
MTIAARYSEFSLRVAQQQNSLADAGNLEAPLSVVFSRTTVTGQRRLELNLNVRAAARTSCSCSASPCRSPVNSFISGIEEDVCLFFAVLSDVSFSVTVDLPIGFYRRFRVKRIGLKFH